MLRYPSNGSQITVTTNVTNNNNSGSNNDTSIIIYDRLGNPLWLGHSDIENLIKKVSVAWKNHGHILQLYGFHINTESRRFIEKTSRKQDQIHWDSCSIEMDKHSDTHCDGRSIRPISFASEECTVTLFLVEYYEQVNIPICTGAT